MRKRYFTLLTVIFLFLVSTCGCSRKDGQQEESLPPAQAPEVTLPDVSPAPPEFTARLPETEPPEPSAPIPGEGSDVTPPETQDPVPSVPPSDEDENSGGEIVPIGRDAIFRIYHDAISTFKPKVEFDVSGMEWEFGAENDLRNIYYAVLSDDPTLKYAYDISVSISDDKAVCSFSYMPYKTGAYESGIPAGSHTINSLRSAKVMAQSMIDGTERMSVAITDPELSVDDIKRALLQAGYGWITFNLSRDGTEITAQAANGKTLEECVSSINDSFRLGSEVIAQLVTDDMTAREKAEMLYAYIAENVAYDFRYYNDRMNMPFESTVAIGALRDNLAICGGYAQAFQTLLDMCGIENYTVSGVSHGENHMWNYVVLDGVGYFCDPTADRGGISRHFLLTVDELKSSGGYSWDHDFLLRISGAADAPA